MIWVCTSPENIKLEINKKYPRQINTFDFWFHPLVMSNINFIASTKVQIAWGRGPHRKKLEIKSGGPNVKALQNRHKHG